ncbi:Protein of unknown function [Duganella sp. CF517]|uniref:DUF1176 domain-containing protein n=1 Tax=Duganella sp. CF517 TaxID=1881038 RepID=UPI0008AB5B13|nr:DUF1176 domain-containing protein [Duganella sp. CF517]SEO58515.1 Protein of unknown function [Duganella sp. CF517]
MKILQYVVAVALALVGSTACAAHFTIKDWEVACDNTRACEAVGYQSEDGDSAPVALWLGRPAGPDAAVAAKLTAINQDETAVGPLTLRVGKLALPGLTSEAGLKPVQIEHLLPALLDAGFAEVTDGKTRWRLSLAGVKAALLKIDDVQGRVGTVTALVKPGAKPASAVLPPVPAPVLRGLPPVAQRKQDAALLPLIASKLPKGGCDEPPELIGGAESQSEISRLSASTLLLLIECGRGAYQSSFAVWTADDKPPYAAQRVKLTDADGAPDNELLNASFDKGELGSFGKGRGLGDCNVQATWLWTAQGFKLSSASSARLCRGIPGGYMLSDWSAQVK